MSEQKKPQAGEWWFYNGGGIKVYIVGTASDGSCVYESKSGEPEGNDDWSGWHHEPRCTSWNWQPEPEPEWFDLTPFDGHVLRERDKGFGGNPSEWMSARWPITTTVSKAKSWGWKQFRCLLKDAPPELLKPVDHAENRWRAPQLSEEPHPDAQYWNRSLQRWVRRGCPKDKYSKMESYRVPVCVMCGTKDVMQGTDRCMECTKYVIESTGCQVESTDDWVDITNGNHIIRKCDQLSDYGTQWYPPSDMTGALGKRFVESGFARLRCRRRDLPPIPEPKPATQTIVFRECVVKHSWDNEPAAYHLEWTSDVSKHSNWIPTGRTETREVVR